MTIRVLVNGALGKMGQTVVGAVEHDPDLNLVAQTDKDDDLSAAILNKQAQVVVDFTAAESAFDNINAIIKADAHPVIGTTGLLPEQIQHLQQQCAEKKLGGLIAPNFSIGAILMMQMASTAAQYLPNVEIIEYHHPGKQDSPSGTALKTAEMIGNSRREAAMPLQTRETIPGARGASSHDINIHAVRLPGLVAHQSVIFGGEGETLTIKHDSIDRICFMPGVLMACKKVINLQQLVYGLEHLL